MEVTLLHGHSFPAHADSDRLQVYSCWVSSVKLNIFCKAMSWTFLAIHKKIPTSSCLNNWIQSPSIHTYMTPSNWHVEWVRSLAPPHQCAWSFSSENKCDSQIPDTVKIQSIGERVKKQGEMVALARWNNAFKAVCELHIRKPTDWQWVTGVQGGEELLWGIPKNCVFWT